VAREGIARARSRAELEIRSRKRIDDDEPKSDCQSANFPMNQWVRTISAARTASAFVARHQAWAWGGLARSGIKLSATRRAGWTLAGPIAPSENIDAAEPVDEETDHTPRVAVILGRHAQARDRLQKII
jgi:hypothetical protein